MIRISQPEAVDDIQRIIVRLGGMLLPVRESGLIVITPEQFAKAIEAARDGEAQRVRAEMLQPQTSASVN
jgi:hypothetical protein